MILQVKKKRVLDSILPKCKSEYALLKVKMS